ncbi:MAG: Crp/Fnr family transcriptional regulator [Rhodospirillales bacterium]|nr:Crp/Fnr family transcriptional regulator [Rhodospirillales bacterium]
MARAFPIDKEAILARNALLGSLDPADRARLADYAVVVRHEADAVIFQRGDPGDGMMAVVRGRVKICNHSADGKELVLNILKPGDVFGEIALLDGEPRTADAVAMETCELLILERRHFLPFLDRHPRVAQRLLAVLCQRLRRTSTHFEDAIFLDVPARLARALLQLASAFGIPAKAGVCIDLKLSQQQLGSVVGVTRESVNKYLGEWQKAGWIAIRNGYITVADAASLGALAGDAEADQTAVPAARPAAAGPAPARPKI